MAAQITPFRPPIDLSDLPNFSQFPRRPRRPVFVGRVSTKDNQNPATSIPRQVLYASARLQDGEDFAAYFWDVESGMLPPDLRGLGPQDMYDALEVPVPRNGGLPDLVERAEEMGITHVLAERSDRLARAMLTSLTVEHGWSGSGWKSCTPTSRPAGLNPAGCAPAGMGRWRRRSTGQP